MSTHQSEAAASAAAEPILIATHDGPVLTLRLNRPKAGNSLSLPMIAALQTALDAAASDDAVHVIVLEGTGDRVFCAGPLMRALWDALP
ncbi:MAG TPA: enoyl-CoA hydratase/isomerase family protein, partial [Quisquiliibacterium sp.]|nr:enoyl-CoA hydratase/isomerase family protein [Quisquiliibacterium sp.]